MDESNNKSFMRSGIKGLIKWIKRTVFIVIAAFIIGFTNAFYNETKMINDTQKLNPQEQVADDDFVNE